MPSAQDWVETQSGTALSAFWPLDGAAAAASMRAEITAKMEPFILKLLRDCSRQ